MGTEDTLKSTGALKCQCRKFSLSAAAAINEGRVKRSRELDITVNTIY